MRTLIKNGTVVTATECVAADVWIEGETIVKVADARERAAFAAEREIDAAGKYVMPGGVDVHTHFDMPMMGAVSRDDFESGTIAAAHGGTTTIIDFANQERGGTLRAALDAWHARAAGKAVIDYGFHATVADANPATLDELASVVAGGVTSFKVFTAYPGRVYSDDGQILQVMQRARDLGALVQVHAENGLAIDVLVAQAVARGERAPRFHALTRPEATEAEATHRVLCLAEVAGAAVYVVHMTSGRAVEHVARFRERGLAAFAETCPQYLFCSMDDLELPGFEGAKYVCSPPPRPRAVQDALWRELVAGHVQTVATDHCPFNFAGDKALGRDDFTKIPNGMPAVETRLLLLWDGGVRAGRFGPSRFVDLVATAPAKLFGLYPRKGTIAAGSDADLLVWDPEREQSLSVQALHMRVDYSPYEGRTVRGAPTHVLSRGEVIVEAGRFLGKPGAGRYLERSAWAPA
jgi:dihydropyrimidinase